MDLDAYFARIGWRGTPELAGLLEHHMRAIPFENFDVLLGRRPRLDLEGLEAKLVTARRGGYCYEHSTLFAAVLAELGIACRTHSARVVMMTPRELAPRTHMFLTVGNDVLDPGFGGYPARAGWRASRGWPRSGRNPPAPAPPWSPRTRPGPPAPAPTPPRSPPE